MNLSQKQIILNAIEVILSFDYDQFIIDNNPSGNVDEIKFGDYTVFEFKNNYVKVFTQLKVELESGLGLILPNQEIFNNEYSSVTLDSESNNFSTYLQDFNNRNAAAEILKRFIYYEVREGFWDKSTVRSHNVDEEKLKKAQANLILAEKLLTSSTDVFNELKSNLNQKIKEFDDILTLKKEESASMTTLLTTAQNDVISITALLSNAGITDANITALLSTIKTSLTTVETDIQKYQKDFDAIELINKKLKESLSEFIEEAKQNLEHSKEGNEFIENQRMQITKLIGMAADGSLGYKFNSRKEELEKGMKRFWRWAVPGSIIVALIWVYIVFACLSANFNNLWVDLIINLVKTSPAWILVGFIFSQYTKERNLQEEYAFKSAIAMTLTAYSQMLSEDDASSDTTRASRQEMLLKAIENLYTQPVLKNEKADSAELISAKPILDSLKSVSDIIKSVKS